MRDIMVHFATRIESETGATAAEYAVMVSLIAIVIVAAAEAIGVSLVAIFSDATLRNGLTP